MKKNMWIVISNTWKIFLRIYLKCGGSLVVIKTKLYLLSLNLKVQDMKFDDILYYVRPTKFLEYIWYCGRWVSLLVYDMTSIKPQNYITRSKELYFLIKKVLWFSWKDMSIKYFVL